MSSESTPPSQEARRTRIVLVPLILGFATAAPSQDHRQQQQQRAGQNTVAQENIMFISPSTNLTTMINGLGEFLEPLFHDLANKDGPLPASKASIEAMPVVKMMEEGAECTICLTEYEVGGEAKEMPCKHRYHSGCIEKWLGIHGSCPVCRYEMPVESNTKGGDVDEEGRRSVGDIEVHMYFEHFGTREDTHSDSNSGQRSESGDSMEVDNY
ncbi:unnamed protein product [Ilex paraguariensis]|uniref:RING-type E3 ubiquitin transferase n=1 Tax=Ilex paraguariensis TaxID=185542 RepID=A0ABC8T0F8_9AQUA